MESTFALRTLAISTMTWAIAQAALAADVSVNCQAVGSNNASGCVIGTVMHTVSSGTTWTFINTGTPSHANGVQTCGEFEAVITKIDGSVRIKAVAVGAFQGKPAKWVNTPDSNKIYTQADLANGPLAFKFQNACGTMINLGNIPGSQGNQVELQFTEVPGVPQ